MPAVALDLDAFVERIGSADLVEALGELLGDTALFVVDSERQVVHWNAGAETLLGWTREQAVGSHCLKTNRCIQCIQECGISKHGSVADVPITLFDAEGRQVPVLKTARAFFAEDGRFLGGIELLRRSDGADEREAASPDPSLDEGTALRQALERSGGRVGKAAELLGISRATFWRRRKKYRV
ncbi:MAG: PAS domain-containing protein [Myxococcales bacterium]|nr:PAS domain-containing protein [Myxococcales bacterium]